MRAHSLPLAADSMKSTEVLTLSAEVDPAFMHMHLLHSIREINKTLCEESQLQVCLCTLCYVLCGSSVSLCTEQEAKCKCFVSKTMHFDWLAYEVLPPNQLQTTASSMTDVTLTVVLVVQVPRAIWSIWQICIAAKVLPSIQNKAFYQKNLGNLNTEEYCPDIVETEVGAL